MSKEDFLLGLKYLSEAFGKDFTKEETAIWYDFIRAYTFKDFQEVIRHCVKNYKFVPKIAEMLDLFQEVKFKRKMFILEIMKNKGYFRRGIGNSELSVEQELRNYEKAVKFVMNDIIPTWLRLDMDLYHEKYIDNKEIKQIR